MSSETKKPLSRKRILHAALDLADSGGNEAVTMRRVAANLGVKAMSLYNHVANKEALLEGVLELVVEEFDLPKLTDPWKDAMRRRGRSAYRTLKKHPWAIQGLMTSRTAGPNMLRYVDATIGCLVEAGFSYEVADHAWHAMDNHIYGFTLQEESFPFDEDEYADAAREYLPQIAVEEYPYFTKLATLVMNKTYSGVHNFEFGLEMILVGLERYRLETGSPRLE